MTRQIKKSLLASAIAAAMGAGASVATADAILFPYLSKGAAVTTIVTVINTSGGERQMHYSYNYKVPVAGESESSLNGRACDHDNHYRNTSKNDIVTFDAGQLYGDANSVLFDDPGAGYHTGTLEERKYNEPFGLMNTAWLGYLVVDNQYDDDGGRYADVELDEDGHRRNQHISLWGEAMSFDFASGAAWGYEAYNPRGGDSYDFSYDRARNGEVLKGSAKDGDHAYRSAIDIVPVGESVNWNERLYVTPVYDDMLLQNIATRIRIGEPVRWDDDKASEWYVYDRNEQPWSVNRAPTVMCVGRVTISDPAFWTVSASGGHLKKGGWTFIDPVAPPEFNKENAGIPGVIPYVDTDEAIVQKLEYGTGVLGSTGTINTAVWLRDFDHD